MSNQNTHIENFKKYPIWLLPEKSDSMAPLCMPLDEPKSGTFIMEEIWKEIPEYNGKYFVSNMGRIKSHFFNKIKILKPRLNMWGYLCFHAFKKDKRKEFFVSRLVAQAFIPNPLNLPEVNHINAIKTDNKVSNLEWVTHKENHVHAQKMGISMRKLNAFQVRVIRKSDLSQGNLAKIFGVTQGHISFIKNFKSRLIQ